MKYFNTIITGILTAGLFCLFGCNLLPHKLSFNEFPQYKNFDENISAIEVNWDINESAPLVFMIEDSNQINEIINMYKDTVFIKSSNKKTDGGNHSYLTFIGENSETTIFLSKIIYGDTKQGYCYPDSKIFDLIKQIGIDAGVLN